MSLKHETNVERASDRELVITRTFNGTARVVFDAFTKPELLHKWWVPRSMGMTMVSCETDVRVGGGYRFVFKHGDGTMAFFGKYLEVVPPTRLVWTNDEAPDGAVTTVTFEEKAGTTLLTLKSRYPTPAAMEADLGFGEALRETFGQLDELLAA